MYLPRWLKFWQDLAYHVGEELTVRCRCAFLAKVVRGPNAWHYMGHIGSAVTAECPRIQTVVMLANENSEII
ncbi:MAG TPA: hypothetical protein VEA59_07200 [Patescibacteria group bacterium]|nr:hypothetical protein [Patescibacteria group bacterium]